MPEALGRLTENRRVAVWMSAKGTDWQEVLSDPIFPSRRDLGRNVDFPLAVAGEKLFVSVTDEFDDLVGFWVLELQRQGGS